MLEIDIWRHQKLLSIQITYKKMMIASEGKILFKVVREAISAANIKLNIDDPQALLVWYDTIKDADYFSTLKPWQVVNRLPNVNLICRKAPFVQMIQRIAVFEPDHYKFLPKSFILPIQKSRFLNELNNPDRKKFLVKPDNGSLGSGITIINQNQKYKPNGSLSVAQEYVESYLINNRKFDLRIYALIASITPLKIYVYRNGVARFCSEENDSNTIYSQLTNTAVNKKKAHGDLNSITKMVDDIFIIMKRDGVDIDSLWNKIDNTIVLTILSSYQYLVKGQENQCKPSIYSRCFQILGFDVLIDQNLNPYILEVNYRPSLDTDTSDEHQMKMSMLSEAINIAVPIKCLQSLITEDKMNFNDIDWLQYVENLPKLKYEINSARMAAEKKSKFVQIYPSSSKSINKIYLRIIDRVRQMPTKIETIYRLPCSVDSSSLNNYSSSINNLRQVNQSPNINQKYLTNIADTSQKRTKAASRMTINKYIPSPGVKNQSLEKIILPKPRQISNTISFSLQMDVNAEEEKNEIICKNPINFNEINRSQSSFSQQPKFFVNPKKSIKKPTIKKTFV